jgi:hypothetical protein
MSVDTRIREDILPEELITTIPQVKVYAEQQYNLILQNTQAFAGKEVTPQPAKNITEVMELIRLAFEDYYTRTHVTDDAKVRFSYEDPDNTAQLETVTIRLEKREPGMYAQGSPFSAGIKQLRPLLREEFADADNPGYRRAVLGQWYDNVICLTPWARTNKAASERALWIETVMEDYAWYFGYMGVSRPPLYQGRQSEITQNVDGQRIYGRPINYFVRTEKIRSVSQKEIEQIVVRMALSLPPVRSTGP